MSRRRQGITAIVIGVAALLVQGVILLTDPHPDSFILWRAFVVAVGGVLCIVVGVLRLRGKIKN